MATYTLPEVAGMLAIPRRTLSSWYEGSEPLLEASSRVGSAHLLSYRDVEEAYRVYLLRERFGYSLQFLKSSLFYARKVSRTQHPLRKPELIKQFLGDLVLDKPARGKNPREVLSLGLRRGQMLIDGVVDAFGERIVEDRVIFPWRHAKSDHESRPVSVNPNVMSGRLVVAGTRVPVSVLAASKRAGHTVFDIAMEYALTPDLVEKALDYVGLRQEAA